ncbi:TIGR03749 family integrating conjugative element protein [Nitrogeniibacter aestuarii]|uniref:TIGR03749 family integrating conjugative element protein n=1 Tax=Nitrogeniibacter aestuarii TaxID=2815343 RepID=UPI001E56F154|nr:TIGR03749 family integrating conjugative element protein [Nitrogeniibacter aestuarii]
MKFKTYALALVSAATATSAFAQSVAADQVPNAPLSSSVSRRMDAAPSAFPELGFLPNGGSPSVGNVSPVTPMTVSATAVAPSAVDSVSRSRLSGDHVQFNQRPVDVLLNVGSERVVDLPFVAMVHLPPELKGKVAVQPIENVLYITASEDFPRTRVFAQGIDGNAMIPMDIMAVSGKGSGDNKDLIIHLPGERGYEVPAAAPGELPEYADMVQLTRHASQSLYAPARLVPVNSNIRRQEVTASDASASMYRGGALAAQPLASWCSGELCVTALKVSNLTASPLQIDQARFRGRWLAVTPQHWRLLPKGTLSDTTAVYLISEGPFAGAF